MKIHFVVHCFATPVLCSMLHPSYSSEAVVRLDYQLLLKSPPLTSLAGFDPAVRDVRSCGCKTARKCCEVAVTNVCGFAMFTLDWWTGPSLESL